MSVSSFLPSPEGGKPMPDLVFQRTTLIEQRETRLQNRAAQAEEAARLAPPDQL